MTLVSKMLSNQFNVKDLGKFREWLETVPNVGEVSPHHCDPFAPAVILQAFYEGIPGQREDADGEMVEMDFFAELSEHLADGIENVAIFMEVGYLTKNYDVIDVHASATVVNQSGVVVQRDLNDIYKDTIYSLEKLHGRALQRVGQSPGY